MDGCTYLSPSAGVAPGLFCATDIFNTIYDIVLHEYCNEASKVSNMLQVPSLALQANQSSSTLVPTAATVFVDDLACSTASCNNLEIPSQIAALDQALDN
eukprot:5186039-Karenia_brevis.AAC.1